MFKLKIIVCIDLFDILINQQTLMPSKFNKRDIKNLFDFVHPLIEYLAIYQNLKLKVSQGGRPLYRHLIKNLSAILEES